MLTQPEFNHIIKMLDLYLAPYQLIQTGRGVIYPLYTNRGGKGKPVATYRVNKISRRPTSYIRTVKLALGDVC